jgi:hypothetical protein
MAKTRQLLSLKLLRKHDIPAPKAHPWIGSADSTTTLKQFIDRLFVEVLHENFETGFEEKGTVDGGKVQITPLASEDDSASGPPTTISIEVQQRSKRTKEGTWSARRSIHREAVVRLSELENLIYNDHSRNEAEYTPNVYDANELLRWDHKELQEACQHSLDDINMSSGFTLQ